MGVSVAYQSCNIICNYLPNKRSSSSSNWRLTIMCVMWSLGSCPNDLQSTDIDLTGQCFLHCLGFHSITSNFVSTLVSSVHVYYRSTAPGFLRPIYSSVYQCYSTIIILLLQFMHVIAASIWHRGWSCLQIIASWYVPYLWGTYLKCDILWNLKWSNAEVIRSMLWINLKSV